MHDKNINHVKPTVQIVWFTIKSQTIEQIQHGGGPTRSSFSEQILLL